MPDEEGRALVEQALAGVEVVTCPECHGRGELPHALHLICPRCQGCGITTKRDEDDDAA